MPVRELSQQRRLRAQFPIRLGERVIREDGEVRPLTPTERRETIVRGAYPREVDYFVLRSDEVPEEVREAYGPKPKWLRIMLPMEYDARHPGTGDELVWNLNNRAFGAGRGLVCRGSGLDARYPDVAMSLHQQWAARVAQAADTAPERVDTPYGTQWKVPCLGTACVKYLLLVDDPSRPGKQMKDPAHDPDQSCKRVGALRFFVLHPTDSTVTLGLAEIATGSVHNMVDIPSDLDVVRAFTGGRTAGVPLTLRRAEKVTFKPVRQVHWTLRIAANQAEAQRWALVPISEVFLSEEQRLRLRQIEATPLAATFDSVRDLYPQGMLTDGQDRAGAAQAGAAAPEEQQAAQEPADPPKGELVDDADASRRLSDTEIRALKELAGGRVDPSGPADDRRNPFTEETTDRLRRFMVAYYEAHGLDRPPQMRFKDLTLGMARWIEPRLREQAPGQ